jgi:hypothetical protein
LSAADDAKNVLLHLTRGARRAPLPRSGSVPSRAQLRGR